MFAQSLPLAAGTMFAVLYVVLYLRKRCCLGRRNKLHRHSSILVAMLLVMFYYLYLCVGVIMRRRCGWVC